MSRDVPESCSDKRRKLSQRFTEAVDDGVDGDCPFAIRSCNCNNIGNKFLISTRSFNPWKVERSEAAKHSMVFRSLTLLLPARVKQL